MRSVESKGPAHPVEAPGGGKEAVEDDVDQAIAEEGVSAGKAIDPIHSDAPPMTDLKASYPNRVILSTRIVHGRVAHRSEESGRCRISAIALN